ncbi:MAG TPA: Gfo/Idh/MocA family oxidoreductase [Spirochaetia bacterium]|nr:Gfo/Idh/MocA family oxidoreductase [Spirochaetia bacterium]
MAPKSIGVAVIGAGRAGMIHARNYARKVRNAHLVCVVDPVADACKAAASELGLDDYYTDYRKALEDRRIDAVVVVTPTVLHRNIVVDAAAAGKHVLCEKPMAMNSAECHEMIDATDRAGTKLQIGFMRRFDRSFTAAYESVRSGAIGDVVLVKSLTHGPSVPQPWMYDIRKSNGPLAEVSSHDIDTLRWFTGSEFAEVYAIAGNYRCPEAREEYPDFYDNVVMNSRFTNGMQGIVEGAVSVSYGYDARLEVLGTKGVLFVGSLKDDSVTIVDSHNRIGGAAVKSWRNLFTDAYEAEDRAFVDAIIHDTEPLVTGRDGMMAVAVVNAGNESIVQRTPVALKAY